MVIICFCEFESVFFWVLVFLSSGYNDFCLLGRFFRRAGLDYGLGEGLVRFSGLVGERLFFFIC